MKRNLYQAGEVSGGGGGGGALVPPTTRNTTEMSVLEPTSKYFYLFKNLEKNRKFL